ncbi:MAG: NAD(P)H-binding protein [Spirochaetia bacterium]|nr:NAD(P)H-binding protein [Spirochaetia bacterium]
MKKLVILGANGQIARVTIQLLLKKNELELTLFARNANRLKDLASESKRIHVVEGDVLNFDKLKAVITGQDIVYANLSGNLEAMAKNIVKAMKETGAHKILFISSIGIYKVPLKPVLVPYRKAADVIEASGLEYTVLRPTWFTDDDEVDYETTPKGEPEKGTVVSQKSLASLIVNIIDSPENYIRQNLGVNKPGS